MIKHIGLQIDMNDLTGFYIELLNGKKASSFILSLELAETIFGIKQQVEVNQIAYEDVELELFVVNGAFVQPSFHHICLQRENADEIYKIAKTKGYYTYVHKNSNTKSTYFIKDKLKNIFEIKSANSRVR